VGFCEALRFWLKLGFISFGGPAGQIAVMHKELVVEKRWISEQRFWHALNCCMLLPGPEAQQLATYIGWLLHRTWGGVVAGALFVLPSLVILITLSWICVAVGHVPWVAALVLQAVHRMGGRTLRHPSQAPLLWLITLGFIAIGLFSLPFPAIVLAALTAGWLGGRFAPRQFSTPSSAHASGIARTKPLPALIDDLTPVPDHARFSRGRLARVLTAGAALWLLPMGVLVAWQRWGGALAAMGWFFTKAALLTFGGACAVLPYVYQGAVVEHGWLLGPQMIDGLALGETTPGPLIMVVAFVGFLGGWGAAGARAGCLVPRWCAGCRRGDLVHLSALVSVHPGRRCAGGEYAWQAAFHRTHDGHHRGRGGRDREPGHVFPQPCALARNGAGRLAWSAGLGRAGHGGPGCGGADRVQAGRGSRDPVQCAGGLALSDGGLGRVMSRQPGVNSAVLHCSVMQARVAFSFFYFWFSVPGGREARL
jgi:chromate transporter